MPSPPAKRCSSGSMTARPTASMPGSPNSTASSPTSAGSSRWPMPSPCRQLSSRSSKACIRPPKSPSSTPRRPCVTGRPRNGRQAEKHDLGFYHALVEAQPAVRASLRPGADGGKPRPLQADHPRQCLLPLGCAERSDPRLCRTRRQRHRGVRDVAARRIRQEARRISVSPTSSAPSSSPARAASSRTPMWRSPVSIPVNAGL